MTSRYDVAIVGSGPSGLTAAIHASFEGLSTVVISPHNEMGGQASQTSLIENYPGFPNGISGQSLMLSFRKQALRLGATFLDDKAIDLAGRHIITEHSDVFATHVIVACGLNFKPLAIPGSQALLNHGLYYGPNVHHLYRDKEVAIIGGANSAGQAALFHSRYASHVHLLTRHSSLLDTMSDKLARDIITHPNITTHYTSELTALHGASELTSIDTEDTLIPHLIGNIPVSAVFVCIGQQPHTTWLRDSGIALDGMGHILAPNLETSLPNVYAIGDVRIGAIHRVILAASDGAKVVANILEKEVKHV